MAAQKHTGNNPLANMFDSIGGAFSGGVTSDQMSQGLTASQDSGGGVLGSALAAGAASGFNPYVMAGSALLGLAKAKSEKEKQKAMGAARADSERAAGEQKKADIQGDMAKSVHTALGGSIAQGKVSL